MQSQDAPATLLNECPACFGRGVIAFIDYYGCFEGESGHTEEMQCKRCHGTGQADGTDVTECPMCRGLGKITIANLQGENETFECFGCGGTGEAPVEDDDEELPY
jgi:DnaJ-class molecular chaperone